MAGALGDGPQGRLPELLDDLETVLGDADAPRMAICWQSAQMGQIRTREDYYYEEPVLSSLRVLL